MRSDWKPSKKPSLLVVVLDITTDETVLIASIGAVRDHLKLSREQVMRALSDKTAIKGRYQLHLAKGGMHEK